MPTELLLPEIFCDRRSDGETETAQTRVRRTTVTIVCHEQARPTAKHADELTARAALLLFSLVFLGVRGCCYVALEYSCY